MRFITLSLALLFIAMNVQAAETSNVSPYRLRCNYEVSSVASAGTLTSHIVADKVSYTVLSVETAANAALRVGLYGDLHRSLVRAVLGAKSQELDIFDLIWACDQIGSGVQFQLDDPSGKMVCVFSANKP